MGHRVARELRETAQARPAGSSFAACMLPKGATGIVRLRDELRTALATLLEAGQVHGADEGRARLDVVLIADLQEVPADGVLAACKAITDIVADDYGVLFPAATEAAERSAWLNVVLATPPLTRSEDGRSAIDAVRSIEQWMQLRARHPMLSRVWVLPRQTTVGHLSDDAVEASLRLFAQGLFLSGVRDDDDVRRRLAHRTDGRFVATFSVAAAELPVARLRRYARWRAAWDGLSRLVERAEHPNTDPARAEALLQRLDPDELLEDYREGDPAQRVRKHAARLSGAKATLPSTFHVGLQDPDAHVRSKYRVLFEEASVQREDGALSSPEHTDVLRLLDKSEAHVLEEAERRVLRLLEDQLDPETALEVLPDVESALDRAVHKLDKDVGADPPTLPAIDPPPPPRDEGLEQLEEVLASRPKVRVLLPVAAGVALAVGVLVAMVTMLLDGSAAAAVPPPTAPGFSSGAPAPTAPSGPPAWQAYVPAILGVVAGIGVATAWLWVILHQARQRLSDQLRTRKQELEVLWDRGGIGQEKQQAEALLKVRRRRSAAGIARLFDHARNRVTGLRAALRQSRDEARMEIGALGVRVADSPERDDLGGLLGEETPLHRSLVPATVLAERIASTRKTQDPSRWAEELLRATWPRDGLLTDLPGTDQAAIVAASDAQFAELGAAQLLGGPEVREVVHERLTGFLRGIGGALAYGIRPRDEHRDPVQGSGRDERLVIAPMDLRVLVEAAMRDIGGAHRFAWGTSNTPWVLVVSTWEGFVADDLERGLGATG